MISFFEDTAIMNGDKVTGGVQKKFKQR